VRTIGAPLRRSTRWWVVTASAQPLIC